MDNVPHHGLLVAIAGRVPIPNTEVKRPRADGTAARPRESRSPPGSFFILRCQVLVNIPKLDT